MDYISNTEAGYNNALLLNNHRYSWWSTKKRHILFTRLPGNLTFQHKGDVTERGCDKTRNRNDGMVERNGKAERNGIKRGTEWG